MQNGLFNWGIELTAARILLLLSPLLVMYSPAAPTLLTSLLTLPVTLLNRGVELTAMRILPLLCPLLVAPLAPQHFKDLKSAVQVQRVGGSSQVCVGIGAGTLAIRGPVTGWAV